ncbi:hypothetical protein L7F22_023683 [Adiantum nelumboides]|nr:hypothetical protein [Adiantum nelumboides]
MGGSSRVPHGQQQSHWMLYDNPFFTERHYMPQRIARLPNRHLRKSTSSFISTGAQCASRGSDFILALESCARPFNSYEAARKHYSSPSFHIPLNRDKFKPGSLVSARKLAATFWELYGVRRLGNRNRDKHVIHAQVRHSHLVAPFKRTLRPYVPCHGKLCEALEETRETTQAMFGANGASTQKTILANFIQHLSSVEERQNSNVAVLYKLTSDLADVANRFQELEFSQQSALKEVGSLLQKVDKQMAITRNKEQEKLKVVFWHLRKEVEEERNTCRLLKKQNKKLAKELTSAKITAAGAREELGRERKARKLLQDVCSELTLEIGKDKAEVEQLKQEQEIYREKLEAKLMLMRMMAMQQDDRSKENVQLLDGKCKECIPFPEVSVESSTACSGERTQGDIDGKQAGQGRLRLQPFCLLELLSHRECGDVCFKNAGGPMAPSVSGASCSGASAMIQETESSTTTSLNRDAGYHVHGEWETLIREEQRGFISKTQKLRKSRRPLHTRREQKRHNARPSDDIVIEESTHLKQVLGNEISKELYKNHSVFTHTKDNVKDTEFSESSNEQLSVSRHFEDNVKADMISSMLCSFSKEDARSRIMRGSSLKRKQESTLHSESMHAARTWQEQSFSGDQDGYDHVHYNFDTHKNTGGRMNGCAGTKLDHIHFEPVNGDLKPINCNNLSLGGQDGEAVTSRRVMGISNHSIEACSETMAKCTQGSSAIKTMGETVEKIVFRTLQEPGKINMEGRDHETMKKVPCLQISARSLPLPCFWRSAPDAYPIFGSRMKACSLRQSSGQDEQTGLYSYADTTEGGVAKEAANQQPLACIKRNSLGAQLIRDTELEKETKSAKPSFCFSPLW